MHEDRNVSADVCVSFMCKEDPGNMDRLRHVLQTNGTCSAQDNFERMLHVWTVASEPDTCNFKLTRAAGTQFVAFCMQSDMVFISKPSGFIFMDDDDEHNTNYAYFTNINARKYFDLMSDTERWLIVCSLVVGGLTYSTHDLLELFARLYIKTRNTIDRVQTAMKAYIYRIFCVDIFLCVQCNAQSLPSLPNPSLPAPGTYEMPQDYVSNLEVA